MTPNERIRERRLELGLTQEEVAKRMGYSSGEARGIVNRYENGREISLKKLTEFADALYCTPSYLMGWDEETLLQKATDYTLEMQGNPLLMELNDIIKQYHNSESFMKRMVAYAKFLEVDLELNDKKVE